MQESDDNDDDQGTKVTGMDLVEGSEQKIDTSLSPKFRFPAERVFIDECGWPPPSLLAMIMDRGCLSSPKRWWMPRAWSGPGDILLLQRCGVSEEARGTVNFATRRQAADRLGVQRMAPESPWPYCVCECVTK